VYRLLVDIELDIEPELFQFTDIDIVPVGFQYLNPHRNHDVEANSI
jgi:hypothetical protein